MEAGTTVIRCVGDVLDARAVTTVFQPIVRLDSWHGKRHETVGYEALTRGPAGTPWEAPLALFEAAMLLASFQEARHFTPATARRYAAAESAALVAALAAGLPGEPAPGVRGTAHGGDDPLRGEWNVVVVGPHFAGALVARDLAGTGPDADRRFTYALTYDRDLVLDAARALLHWIVPT